MIPVKQSLTTNTSFSSTNTSSWTLDVSTASKVMRSPNFLSSLLYDPLRVLKCFIFARMQESQYGFLYLWVNLWFKLFASLLSVPLLATLDSPSTTSISMSSSSPSATSSGAPCPSSSRSVSSPPGGPSYGVPDAYPSSSDGISSPGDAVFLRRFPAFLFFFTLSFLTCWESSWPSFDTSNPLSPSRYTLRDVRPTSSKSSKLSILSWKCSSWSWIFDVCWHSYGVHSYVPRSM